MECKGGVTDVWRISTAAAEFSHVIAHNHSNEENRKLLAVEGQILVNEDYDIIRITRALQEKRGECMTKGYNAGWNMTNLGRVWYNSVATRNKGMSMRGRCNGKVIVR